MSIIDAHTHLAGDHPESLAMLEELDLKVLNICVSRDPAGQWRHQVERYRRLADAHPSRFAWCTTFDIPGFDDPAYADRVIRQLEADFAAGAVGCKVWKNVGMEIRKPDGQFLMIDEPVLEPIFAYLEQTNRTVMTHIAEPLACWQPLTPGNPHCAYYTKHPEWHMFGRAGVPSHENLMAARDRVLARHPRLRVVGAHLGSLEYDVGQIALRLACYPNFAVDTSARLLDLAGQDRSKVREFFLAWQDRIIFGTDIVAAQDHSGLSDDQRRQLLAARAIAIARNWPTTNPTPPPASAAKTCAA